jgi:hypothetical protein
MATTTFSNTQDEINYFLSHIARSFMGGQSGSGENGIDVALPQDTPIYAVEGGKVIGSGYYGGGGVVSIQSAPGKVWYYQHLDQDLLKVGQNVSAGQEVGLSGGQNVGGSHPSTPEFSSFPHIEIGLNAPWGGIWGGGQAPNVDPVPYLQALAHGGSAPAIGSTSSTASGSTASNWGTGNITDPSSWLPAIVGSFASPLGITDWRDLLWRVALTSVGIILIFIGINIMAAKGAVDIAEGAVKHA